MTNLFRSTLTTLTDFELKGLSSPLTLADGHAYHGLEQVCADAVDDLPIMWRNAAKTPIPDMETKFRDAFANLIGSSALASYPHFRVCPTASNSIDIVGASLVASGRARDVALVEPTFDNLALLLRRRGVQLRPVAEADVFGAADSGEGLAEQLAGLSALVLANPNNPTGAEMPSGALTAIIELCRRSGSVLIIDASFRLYNRHPFDDYEMLIAAGISFVVIEDTGKVWPTLDLKASLLVFSEDLAQTFNEIYNELYLCVSNFTLELMSYLCRFTATAGIPQAVWRMVDSHRKLLRGIVTGTELRVSQDAVASGLSVEWVSCSGIGSDIDVVMDLDRVGLSVLPGRHFFWASQDHQSRHSFIRFSLARPAQTFVDAMTVLSDYLRAGDQQPLWATAKLPSVLVAI